MVVTTIFVSIYQTKVLNENQQSITKKQEAITYTEHIPIPFMSYANGSANTTVDSNRPFLHMKIEFESEVQFADPETEKYFKHFCDTWIQKMLPKDKYLRAEVNLVIPGFHENMKCKNSNSPFMLYDYVPLVLSSVFFCSGLYRLIFHRICAEKTIRFTKRVSIYPQVALNATQSHPSTFPHTPFFNPATDFVIPNDINLAIPPTITNYTPTAIPLTTRLFENKATAATTNLTFNPPATTAQAMIVNALTHLNQVAPIQQQANDDGNPH